MSFRTVVRPSALVVDSTTCWHTFADDGPVRYPDIENLVTGNATIMRDGELTSPGMPCMLTPAPHAVNCCSPHVTGSAMSLPTFM